MSADPEAAGSGPAEPSTGLLRFGTLFAGCLIALVCVLVSAAVVGGLFATPDADRQEGRPIATLEDGTGEVRVRRAGEAADRTASDGDGLFAGDRIETGQGASCVVVLADRSRFLLGAGSVLHLVAGEVAVDGSLVEARLDLVRGQLEGSFRQGGSTTLTFQGGLVHFRRRELVVRAEEDDELPASERAMAVVAWRHARQSRETIRTRLAGKEGQLAGSEELLAAADAALEAGEFERSRGLYEASWREAMRVYREERGEWTDLSVTTGGQGATQVEVYRGDAQVGTATFQQELQAGQKLEVSTDRGRSEAESLGAAPVPDEIHRRVYNTDRTKVAWSALPGATTYRIEISGDPLFSPDAPVRTIESDDPHLDLALERDRTFYWRIQAIGDEGKRTAYSEVARIEMRTDEDPPPIELERMGDWK